MLQLLILACALGDGGTVTGTVTTAVRERVRPVPGLPNDPACSCLHEGKPKLDDLLVWRTEVGFGATSLSCTHCTGDLRYVPEEGVLKCPFNVRFKLDGSVIQDSVRRKPLRAYIADLQGDRLRILG